MKKIIWIASYPKSGNTYLRSLLSYYLYGSKGKFSFDLLRKITKFESIDLYKKVLPNKLLTKNFQYHKYFIDVQKLLIEKYTQKDLIFKTHHFFGDLNDFSFTNKETTLLFIYLVRDPREVLISYARYNNRTIEHCIDEFVSDKIMRKIHMEIIVNWSLHYKSWKSFRVVPSLFIKYENLVLDPKNTFLSLLNFLKKFIDISIDDDLVNKSISLTKFNNLKKLENNSGFIENLGSNNFFHSGKIDSWKNILNKNQKSIIENNFKKEMYELGYLK